MTAPAKIIAVCLVSIFLSSPLFSQLGNRQGNAPVSAKMIELYSPEKSEMLTRILIQVVNDKLTFIKKEDRFEATVQVEIVFTRTDTEETFARTFDKQFTVDNFDLTNSESYFNTFYSDLSIDPGDYSAKVLIHDKNNNAQLVKNLAFEVRGFDPQAQNLAVSNLLFFEEFGTDKDGNITAFNPKLDNTFSSEEKYLYMYFNTFSTDPAVGLNISYKVFDERDVVTLKNQYKAEVSENGYSEHHIRLSRYYFNRNSYRVELTISNGSTQVDRKDNFYFFWQYLPSSEENLDMAIRQLRYIGKDDSIKHYLKASYDEKRSFFQRFWESKDPNPDTEVNELMVEYYRRIQVSNFQFSNGNIGGWITDRGRIYIKFGDPDDIERHPFEANSNPYEIWRYYSLQKNFLFVDRTGFGDYDLHPNYYYVEFE